MQYFNQIEYDETDQSSLMQYSNSNLQKILIIKNINKRRRTQVVLKSNYIIKQYPVVNNVVSVAKISMKSQENYKWPQIFLPKFAQMCKSTYQPKYNFDAVQLWLQSPDCQATVFKNGRVVLKTKNIEDINSSLDSVCKLISMSDEVSAEVKYIKIGNIVANGQLPFRLDSTRINKIDRNSVPIKFKVSNSGAIFFFAEKIYQINSAFEKLCVQLKRCAI